MNMDKLVWTVSATYHDWRDYKFCIEFIQNAYALGLIGDIEWIEAELGSDKELLSINLAVDLPNNFLNKYLVEGEGPCWVIGGEAPFPWSLAYVVDGYSVDSGILRGANWIHFTFDKYTVDSAEKSQSLMESFCKLHRQENTEYAKIHLYNHRRDLNEGEYEIAVTNLLHGIYWANYLAPGHIHLFDKEKLNTVDPWKILKKDDNELCFITSPNLNLADSRESEIEIVRLTKLFKAALIDTE